MTRLDREARVTIVNLAVALGPSITVAYTACYE